MPNYRCEPFLALLYQLNAYQLKNSYRIKFRPDLADYIFNATNCLQPLITPIKPFIGRRLQAALAHRPAEAIRSRKRADLKPKRQYGKRQEK